MTVTYVQHDQALRIHAATYRLVFNTGRPHAVLEDADGTRWADLCLVSSLHTRGGLDETASLAPPKVQTHADGGCRLVLEAKSSLWEEKRLVFTCRPDVLEAHVEVTGRGALADCYLFGGYYSGQLRWGSGFFESGAHFRSVFNPEPYASERRAIPAAESTAIDVMGTSMPGKRHWFFTPAPLCYAFSQSEAQPDGSVPAGPWLIAGLATPPGQHHFT
ncbi:MAG TPA: hypothetical protein VGW38_21355, partial [Chloroflexota bacterium]|nr:hypothetical protein [Chloroflexota bacterium]